MAPRPCTSRRALTPITALLAAGLSCTVVPPAAAPPAAPEPEPLPAVSTAPAAPPADPVLEAVHRHLLEYRRRSGLTDAELERLADAIVEESRRHELDPALVLAVVHVESRFDAFAVSPKQALGLMQILPSTGAWLAERLDIPWHGPQTLFDPVVNVRIGVAYLRQLHDRYGSLPAALAAYNWGPGHIDGRLRRGVPLPREYPHLVLTAYETGSRSS